ncbi:aldehyde dehydrogenase family protein [Streptomyces sp. SL13]|uniref:Aldehyde dehydrogenase family protein n=1 Tax=Streptantibioticus silvisoli TaxID=2705255 RepID=A0AA90K9T0_9ACTN|nr:aldehyde dehydrogenase family protein [Streptantibioticus silvisoli]MDI5971217.1 aldehyde dehydrogenase family protein [Streptantibioticus silvisoli]
MTMAGSPVRTEALFDVLDPATGEVCGRAPDCTGEQLDAAVAAAAGAWPAWRSDAAYRRRCLAEAAVVLRGAAGELAALLTMEQGKPLRESATEVARAAARFEYFAGLEYGPQVVEDGDEWRVEVHRRPFGPVAALVPWNLPLQLAAAKAVPALATGNTVVLKPSPHTPLATLELGRLLAGVFPPGVLNVVSGRADLGRLLVRHPGIRKVNFTGSTATGQSVAAAAAPDLKRLTLELGGNDAAIVLDDADVERVAEGVFAPAFANCGQLCLAIKRVYVPDALHDDLVAALAARAGQLTVGNGADPATGMGPVNNRAQFERVTGLVADALAHGARAAAGGHALDGPGTFHAPTVLDGLTDGVRVVDEEQFGPVLPVIRYRDTEDALARANNSPYGLAGSVWGTDLDRAASIAERMECGTAWVNAHIRMTFTEPFAGSKWSGLGVSGGEWSLHSHTEPFVVHRPKK